MGWKTNDQYHPVAGPVYGSANLISASTPPLDVTTLVPVAGGSLVDAAAPAPAAAAGIKVEYQLDPLFIPKVRSVNGTGPDIGAVER